MSKIPAEIHALVPEEFQSIKYGIYWSNKGERYYVFWDERAKHSEQQEEPAPGKRPSKQPTRHPLGSIKDGVFTYSRKYLANQRIRELILENERLTKELEGEKPQPVKTVSETITETSNGQAAVGAIQKAASSIKDPRKDPLKIVYPLEAVLFVVLLASLSGYTSAVSIAVYWRQNRAELSELIENFPDRDISHDTINRLLRLISAEHFQELISILTEELVVKTAGRLLHVDGQAVRASKTEHCDSGRYFLNVYDSVNCLALCSCLVEEKTSEITAAPVALESINLQKGDVVTADAMNMQHKLLNLIHEKGADFCFPVKGNQSSIVNEVRFLLTTADESRKRYFETLDAGHGRVETRKTVVLPARLLSTKLLEEWPGLENGCIAAVENTTEAKSKRARNSVDTRYFITTIPYGDKAAERISDIVRRHWTIENNLQWALDVQFDQDRIQCTNENYLCNRITLNKIALNLIRTVQNARQAKDEPKLSVPTIQQLCGTPAGALETMGMALGVSNIAAAVKS